MASPFKQKKAPAKKDPPKKKTPAQIAAEKKATRITELRNADAVSRAKGKPGHGGDVYQTNIAMKSAPIIKDSNVDKATGGPAKRAIANMIAGRTSHAKAKGALNIVTGEETESLYS